MLPQCTDQWILYCQFAWRWKNTWSTCENREKKWNGKKQCGATYRMMIWIVWLFRVDVEQTRENCHGEAVAEVWNARSAKRTWLRCASLSFRSYKVCNDQLSSSAPSGFPKRPTNNWPHPHAHIHHGATSTQAHAPLPILTRKWWATFLPKNVDFSVIGDGWSFFHRFWSEWNRH